MPKYNHVYTLAFTVRSNREDASDVIGINLITACLKRMVDLTENGEWLEACAGPDDTYKED